LGAHTAAAREDVIRSQVVEHDRENHSKKPQIFRDKIVQLFGEVPKLELFARDVKKGWDAWGNEVENSITL
jgi:N6-adenosine-specific RNA methylase IME4